MENYYKCDDCKYEFDDDQAMCQKEEYGDNYITECPRCHSTEIDEGYKCEICDKWIEEEVLPEVYLCKNCLAKKTKEVQTVLQAVRNGLDEISQTIYDDLVEFYK